MKFLSQTKKFRKRIKSYQKQDSKAGRPVVDLTIDEVRHLLSGKICQHCEVSINHGNWSLDRVDNSKSHSF